MVSRRWILGQQSGLAAFPLTFPGVEKPMSDACQKIIADLVAEGRATDPFFIGTLPLSTLHLLKLIRPQVGRRLQDVCGEAADTLDSLLATQGRQLRPAALSRILTLVYFMLYGRGDACQVSRLGASLFRASTWHILEQTTPEAGRALAVLRAGTSSTEARCEAIETLRSVFGGCSVWPHCENFLYDFQFAWPLLVAERDDASLSGIGISLPVMVDVKYDPAPEEDRLLIKPAGQALANWADSFWQAAGAAKVLWANKHDGFEAVQQRIHKAQVVFDLSVAIACAEPFEEITASDRSMEAYFAQVVLNRLMGRMPAMTGVASGQIGPRVRADASRTRRLVPGVEVSGGFLPDFEFEWPSGEEAKIRLVFYLTRFESAVFPELALLPQERADRLALLIKQCRRTSDAGLEEAFGEEAPFQTTSVQFAAHLSNVADCLQPHGWRERRYFRCPDIGAALEPGANSVPLNQLPEPQGRGVQWCLKVLKANTSAVLEVPEGITALDVAAALRVIDRERWKTADKYKGGKDLHYRLWWTFIRATLDQVDVRFWHLLWKSMGAPDEDFAVLLHAPDSRLGAEVLARALNHYEPTAEQPSFRSPDIVVVFAADELMKGYWEMKNPLSRPLAFDPVLNVLNEGQLLEPVRMEYMRRRLGSTRIIVVREDLPIPPVSRLPDSQDDRRLRCLRTYRFSFTLHQATRLLQTEFDISGSDVREWLDRMVERGVLGRFSGEYFVVGLPGRREDLDEDVGDSWKRHWAAALGFAPYLAFSSVTAANQSRALLPEFVNEATYHLQRSLNLGQQALDPVKDQDRLQLIRTALQRLHRFFELPGWWSVVRLTQGAIGIKDAYVRAQELLAERRKHPHAIHPTSWVNMITATAKWLARRQSHRHKPELLAQLDAEIRALFENAEAACAQFQGEENYNLLMVLTRKIQYLLTDAVPIPDDAALVEELNGRALLLLEQGTDGSSVPGEWYEQRADAADGHLEAASIYQLGVRWTPTWHQHWVKFCGASILGHNGDTDHADACLRQLPLRTGRYFIQAQNVLSKAYGGLRRDLEKPCEDYVLTRWKAGIRHFQRHFRRDRDAQRIIQQKYEPFLFLDPKKHPAPPRLRRT